MLKNGFFSLTGAMIRLIAGVIVIPFLIRLLGVEEYGLWTLVGATISVAALAEAGLSIATTVFLSRDMAANNAEAISETLSISVTSMLLLSSAVALVLFAGADGIVALFPKLTPEERVVAVAAIQTGSIVVWARLMQQVFLGPIQALQRYDIFSFITTAQSVVQNAVLLLIAYAGGATALLMQGLAGVTMIFFLATLVVSLFLLRHKQLRFRFTRTKFREIGSYSILTWISALGHQFFTQGDRLIVGFVLGTSVLGVYGAITTISAQIAALTAMTLGPLLPMFSALWVDKGPNTFALLNHQIKRATALNALIALGCGAAVFVLTPYILDFVIPTSVNAETLLAFRISVIIYATYLLNGTGYYLLFAIGELRANLIINLASGSLALILIAIGAAAYGLIGAVTGQIGFAASLLFIVWGFRCVRIPLVYWLHWNAWPLAWFVSVLILNTWLGSSEVGLLVFAFQGLALLSWFAYTERTLLIGAWQRVHD